MKHTTRNQKAGTNLKLLTLAVAVFALTLLGAPAKAKAAMIGDNCPRQQVLLGRWIFNRMWTSSEGCTVQVTPKDKPKLTYREYVFDESGRFVIFDSTDGEYETSTAQQNYFLFPMAGVPTMTQVGQTMVISAANGTQFTFAADKPLIQAVSDDLLIRENPQLTIQPGANFKILKFTGVLLDAGAAVGKRAHRDELGKSVFTILGEKSCEVRNDEIFSYRDPLTNEDYYQPVFKFPAPDQLVGFLQSRCGW